MIKLLVVDDHAMIRAGLIELLRHSDDLEVVGEAGNGREAIEQTEALKPDVVLMDLAMPVMDGVTATRVITKEHPNVAVVALTTYSEPERVRAALDAGARGYLTKDVEGSALVAAIRTACTGGMPLSPSAVPGLTATSRPSRSTEVELSAREIEILRLVAAGQTNRQIGSQLGITEKTVKAHLGRIFQRIGASERREAVRLAQHLL